MNAPPITSKPRRSPSRTLLFAPPKWGKSSFAAYAPSPIFLMTRGEDGLRTLIDYGRVPEVPHFEEPAFRWTDVLAAVDFLIHGKHDYRTAVIDTLNGAGRLLLEDVCDNNPKFGGDWAEFDAYGRGIGVAEAPWLDFLERLEYLRSSRNMSLIMLAHAKNKTVKNPGGADYDQVMPDLPDKFLSAACRWADCLLYGGFENREKKTGKPGAVKVEGAGVRTITTAESAAHVVGNRYGLPRVIRGGESGADLWKAFASALQAARPHALKPEPAKSVDTESPSDKPAVKLPD